jgi:hypothetical protein
MCSHQSVHSKCVQYPVDKFFERPSGVEANQALDPSSKAVGVEFSTEGLVQKFTV